MRASVTKIEIELIAHATEDLDKVVEAAKAILPPGARDKVKFKVKELRGHYGNPIRLVKARVRDRQLAQAVFDHMISGLPEEDRWELLKDLKRRTSGGSLYMRLDKQWAFMGQLKLSNSDPIWIKVSFSSSKIDEIREALRGGRPGP